MPHYTEITRKLRSVHATNIEAAALIEELVADLDRAKEMLLEYKAKQPTSWQQIMDRLEGRVLCYGNAADKAKGGPKLYTRAQVEGIRAKAMVEARLIVWMFKEDDETPKS